MFLKTLPVVPVRASTGHVPESGVLTSVSLPMLAEKGFGVPVRTLEEKYLEPLCRRIYELTMIKYIRDVVDYPVLRSLRKFQVTSSRALQQEPPTKERITSDYMVSKNVMNDMLELLLCKEEFDLAWVGLHMTDCERKKFLPEHRAYMMLLHSLEETGVLRGIRYEYDVWYGDNHMPPYADVRTFYVDRYRIYDNPSVYNETRDTVLEHLAEGCRIDADAEPLQRFFKRAYEINDSFNIKRLQFETRMAVGRYVGGRHHDVAQVTVVKAID